MHHQTDMLVHTTAFVTLVVEHWLKLENRSVGPVAGINPMTHCTASGCSIMELHLDPCFMRKYSMA